MLDDLTAVDATLKGGFARFINHSCDPNCKAQTVLNGDKLHIVLYACKKLVLKKIFGFYANFCNFSIDAGEEMSYNYKLPYEDDKVPCLCGANNCRGTLN